LAKASRLVAKVDSAAVQDGFDLYLHGFIVTDDANWVVVQQGMNGDLRQARRYHWLSEGVGDFVNEPHAAIEGVSHGEIINITDRRAATSRDAQLDLLKSLGPDGITKENSILIGVSKKNSTQPNLPHLIMPARSCAVWASLKMRSLLRFNHHQELRSRILEVLERLHRQFLSNVNFREAADDLALLMGRSARPVLKTNGPRGTWWPPFLSLLLTWLWFAG
jgi:hypothetical protein